MSEVVTKIRELLRRDQIKLWLPPYTKEDLSEGNIPGELISKYCVETGYVEDQVLAAVRELRSLSTKRSVENKRFAGTGVAVLNISCARSDGHSEETVLETTLNVSGLELKQRLADEFQISVKEMKLVAAGNFLENSRLLQEQNVAHNCHILCIQLNKEHMEVEEEAAWRQSISRTRAAAARLAGKSEDDLDPHFLQVEDQTGQPLKLPQEEKEALAVAMALHERGRNALKQKNFGCALLFFLEADHEFKQCRSDILKCVDNYAILCLDIVWCYLQLREVNSLPDAEARLKSCEDCFRRSYGPKFERLAALKAGVELERGLIIRLKLLQGILCFHKREYYAAKLCLDECEKGIRELDVDEEKLTQLMCMGYGASEGRLGLRACHGNMEAAVQMIVQHRERERKRKEEWEGDRKRVLARRLGKTVNGTPVAVDVYEQLIGMGFRKSLVISALRESNNDISTALEIMRVNSDAAERSDSDIDVDKEVEEELLHTLVSELLGMGFDFKEAKKALRNSKFDLDKAVEILTKSAVENKVERSESFDEDEKAFKELHSEIADNPFDHLDTTFEEEKMFSEQYRALIIVHI